MVDKRIKLILKLLLSSLVVGYVSLRVNWGEIGRALLNVDPLLYLISTLLTLLTSMFIAVKYHALIRGSVIDHSMVSLIRINLISRFYALVLPFGTARDAVRWYKVTRNRNGRAFFLACTLFERGTFVLILLIFGYGLLFFFPSTPELSALSDRIFPLVIVVLFVVCAVNAYFLFPAVRSFLDGVVIWLLPAKQIRERIVELLEGFALPKNKTLGLFSWLLLITMLWQAVFWFRIYTLFQATAVPLDLLNAAWMGSMVLLLQMLPLSFAGIGIREGAYAYLFSLSGLSPEKGVLIGILFFSQMLILAGVGGLLELFET